jgi:propionyl-CoA synthetase
MQDEVQKHSLSDPVGFWSAQAARLHWHKTPTSTLTKTTKRLGKNGNVEHPHWRWFDGGEISTCFNCVDRHVLAGNGDKPAVFWDSPVTGAKQTLTYTQLLDEVETMAGALREEGVKKGDVVLVYSMSISRFVF